MSDFDTAAFFASIGKGRGKFAANSGMILVSTEFYVGSALMRDANGWYNSRQTEVAEIGRGLAEELAKSVAMAAKAQMLRPRVSSGRLQAALLDPKNRVGVKEGYGVGKPEFLDRSEAKYWRQIDQGYSGHVGREIRGVWGNRKGPFDGMSSYGKYMIPKGQYTAFGAGLPIGKLYPLGKKSAYAKLAAAKFSGKLRNKPKVEGFIDEAIVAQQYFRRGWEEFNARGRTTQAVKLALKSSLPPASPAR